MKSVYACTKPDGTLALAFDLVAIEDSKVLGALLRLAGENSLIVDRVERDTVLFEDPILIRASRDKARDKAQIEIDFSKPAAGDRGGPSSMPEGFSCGFSGACPTPSKACATCEFASNGIPKATKPDEPPAADAPTLADDMKSSAFMQWASMSPAERAVAGIEKPEGFEEPADEPTEDVEPDDADEEDFIDEPDEKDLEEWEDAVSGAPAEEADTQSEDVPF